MAYDHQDDSGSLFKNDRKKSPKHPDYTGSAKVDGTEFWLSAWLKGGTNGKPKFMSLAFTPKEKGGGGGKQSSGDDEVDDEIPF